MLCVRIGLDEGRFWPDPGGDSVAWWSIGVPATALFTVILTWVGRTWSLERWIGLIPAAVLCYAALSAFRIAPAYVAPHYSMKQASRSLGLSLASSAGLGHLERRGTLQRQRSRLPHGRGLDLADIPARYHGHRVCLR